MTTASVNDMKVALEMVCAGMVAIGVLFIISAIFMGIRLCRKMLAPLPDAATDKLLQQLNGESRWRKQ